VVGGRGVVKKLEEGKGETRNEKKRGGEKVRNGKLAPR